MLSALPACKKTLPSSTPATATPSLANPTATPTIDSSELGPIVFLKNFSIWTMNADGSNQIFITDHSPTGAGLGFWPNWSSDGTKLVVIGRITTCTPSCSSEWEIFVLNSNGTGVTQISTITDPGPRMPLWSPTGDRILYSLTSPGLAGFHVLKRSGSSWSEESFYPTTLFVGDSYGWYPDGVRFFYSGSDGNLHWIDPAIPATGLITTDGAVYSHPAISPDGSKFLFTRGASQLYTMLANGSGVTLVTPSNPIFEPSWSADGTRIIYVFNTFAPDQTDIYSMNPAGTGVAQLTAGLSEDRFPRWH